LARGRSDRIRLRVSRRALASRWIPTDDGATFCDRRAIARGITVARAPFRFAVAHARKPCACRVALSFHKGARDHPSALSRRAACGKRVDRHARCCRHARWDELPKNPLAKFLKMDTIIDSEGLGGPARLKSLVKEGISNQGWTRTRRDAGGPAKLRRRVRCPVFGATCPTELGLGSSVGRIRPQHL
jgi:hypothetical protein